MTQIQLNVISSCADGIQLGWTIFTTNDELLPLCNCSLISELQDEPEVEHWFPLLQIQGTYKLEKKLLDGVGYKFRLICGRTSSNLVSLISLNNCTQAVNKSHDPDVVYEKQTGLFQGGTQDTVLGIVFGLFGFSIILVTSYYLWRRYRNRQRRQRIRSYLGASMIDPFTSMQNRMDEIEANGGERLIGSTDTL